MPAQAPGNLSQDDVAVIELDREGRAWKNLLDAPITSSGASFKFCGCGRFGHAHSVSAFSIANSDG